MPRRGITYMFAVGSFLPLTLFTLRHLAGGNASDFWAMYNAGRAILAGESPYGGEIIFPYPPHSLFLFLPLSVAPFQVGLLLFNLLGASLFAFAARAYLPKDFPALFAILTPAALFCFFYGQTGLLVGGLWLLAFRGRWWAVALLTIKPHLGILSVLSLRSFRQLFYTSVGIALLCAISVAAFGPQSWIDFFAALSRQANFIGVRPRWNNIGISPAMGFGFLIWLVLAAATAIILSKKVTVFTTATAALLISPYAFMYDMPVASLGFVLALQNHWEDLRLPDRLALILAFFAPCYVFWAPLAVPLILLWALWVQVRAEPDEGTWRMERFVRRKSR